MISSDAANVMFPHPLLRADHCGVGQRGSHQTETLSPRLFLGLGGRKVFPPRLSLLLSLPRAANLEKEVAGLREKIHHLDDMLKSQQRKVRQMIEQVRGGGPPCRGLPPLEVPTLSLAPLACQVYAFIYLFIYSPGELGLDS